MIKFGMASCLVTFDGEYYEYKGNGDNNDKGLAIGGYESAFLADLVASYLLEKSEKYFEKTKFHGIYRDDGLIAFNDIWSFQSIQKWLKEFQTNINEITNGTFIQFTMEIWKPGESSEPTNENCSKITDPNLPFLDMKMSWSTTGKLSFKAFAKPGQKILYVDNKSTHRRSCLRAIPNGVLKRLSRLTSDDGAETATKSIDDIYPMHIEALREAKLLPSKEFPDIPRMHELWKKNKRDEKKKINGEKKKKRDKRCVYFVMGFSKFWSNMLEPLHRTIDRILSTNNLKWLRTRVSYRKYSNLGELFNADLVTKLNKDLLSLDFMKRPCNCATRSKINGQCPYDKNCRTSCIIYQVTCKETGLIYIGNTQQTLKDRMYGHYADLQKLVFKGIKSDSFASHYSTLFEKGTKPSPAQMREKMSFSILWQGNPITVNKTFGSKNCRLCMRERTLILKNMYREKCQLVNNKSEIYGTCRHIPKFHRFTKISTGTDESELGRKSTDNCSATTVSIEGNLIAEEENFDNRIYCRNVNEVTPGNYSDSYSIEIQPTLPTA